MKKLFTVLILIFCAFSNLFGLDYETLLNKANLLYKKNNELAALNFYWEAMKLSLGEKNEAYEQFSKITSDIIQKMELSKTCDEFEIYETWKNRLESFEEYYSKHIPITFEISSLEQESLDYEKKTGKYSFTVNAVESGKYQIIREIYAQGLKNNKNEEWSNYDSLEEWPYTSFFNSVEEAEKSNVFLTKNIDKKNSNYRNAILNKYFTLDISMYDKETNEVFRTCSVNSFGYSICLEDIPQSVIKRIKKNKIAFKVDKITLRYGEYAPKTISKNNAYTTYSKSGMATIHVPSKYWEEDNPNYKPMEEKDIPLKSVSVHLPNKKYKKDINPILFASELDFLFVEGGSVDKSKSESISVDSFYICKTPVSYDLYKNLFEGRTSYKTEYDSVAYNVSFPKVVKFCNELSIIMGYEPCYSFNGETDPNKWIEYPHRENDWEWPEEQQQLAQQWDKEFICNFDANGFRIPTYEESLYMWKNNVVSMEKEWCWLKTPEPDSKLEPSIFYKERLYDNSYHVWHNTDYHYPYVLRLVRSKID